MTDGFEIVGLEDSDYPVKGRSTLRYQEIPFRWPNPSLKNDACFKKNPKFPCCL